MSSNFTYCPVMGKRSGYHLVPKSEFRQKVDIVPLCCQPSMAERVRCSNYCRRLLLTSLKCLTSSCRITETWSFCLPFYRLLGLAVDLVIQSFSARIWEEEEVLWHCWLGHSTRKNCPQNDALNPCLPYLPVFLKIPFSFSLRPQDLHVSLAAGWRLFL